MRYFPIVSLIVGIFGFSRQARSDTEESHRTTAEALFIEAKRLMAEGRASEACPKLADSQRLDPAVGTLLNLARCYEQVGKTASAWSTYREAAGAAGAAGQLERERAAREHAAALEPRLSRLAIVIVDGVAALDGLEVKLDGDAVPATLWGLAFPANPGRHLVQVSAKGKSPWSGQVDLTPSTRQAVAVPSLADSSFGEATTPTTGRPQVATPIEGRREEGNNGHAQRTIALVLGGATVVGATVGTILAASANSRYHEADDECSSKNVCSPSGIDLRNSAFDKASAATVGFALAGVAAATGVVLWITSAPQTKASRVGLAVSPPVDGASWAVAARGVF